MQFDTLHLCRVAVYDVLVKVQCVMNLQAWTLGLRIQCLVSPVMSRPTNKAAMHY